VRGKHGTSIPGFSSEGPCKSGVAVQTSTLLARVGRRIAELRGDRTQQELAERLDCDVRDLQRIEAGARNVTIKTLVDIANALRVDPAELFAMPAKRRRRTGRPRRVAE
jgi:ribosome-binding protein aMBF1 (putative translation factor)